jgi:hypothetical protein
MTLTSSVKCVSSPSVVTSSLRVFGARRQGFFDLLVAAAAVGLQVKGAVAPVGLDRVGV